MKFYTTLSLIGLGLGIAAFSAQGCGSSDDSSTASSSAGRQPPQKPSGPATTSSDEKNFAISELFLGDTDRTGKASTEAWKEYGFNLDGLITTRESTNVCARVGTAAAKRQEDGKEGIDNAFGSSILEALTAVLTGPSKTVNAELQAGSFTIMLNVKGLTDDPAQTNTGLSGELLVGGPFGAGKTPTFTPADDWPFRAEPRVPLTDAYINKGTFVNGSGGAAVNLSLFIANVTLALTINKAIITFDHTSPDEITNGTIAGVLDTEQFIKSIEGVAGFLSTALCTGGTLDTIKKTIREASDILSDGTNRPGTQCNAISVGLGFKGKRIGPPKTTVPDGQVGNQDPCNAPADAGSDSGSDAGADAQ